MKLLNILIVVMFLFSNCINAQQICISQGNDSLLMIESQNLRKIILKFPDRFDHEKEYPLLIVLHGNGGNANAILREFYLFSSQEFIIVFPEGHYSKLINGTIGYSWFFETKDKNIHEAADRSSIEDLVEQVNGIKKRYRISKTFVFGFSQGASLAYMCGLNFPDVFSGIIAVGGLMPEIDRKGSVISTGALENAKNLKILISRGNRDQLISRKTYEYQKLLFEKKGYEIYGFEYDGGHYFTKELLYKVFDFMQKVLNAE